MVSRNAFLIAIALGAYFEPAAVLARPMAPVQAAARQYRYPTRRKVDNRPLPQGVTAATVHAPYGTGDCSLCHRSSDPKNPGPVTKAGNALCYECHQEFEEIMARKYKHPPALEACTTCHNAHDSRQPGLLHGELASQCMECHKNIRAVAETSKVKHGALTSGKRCANCHNPHGANIEKLLTALPFDQCVGCHSVDDLKDWNGVRLTNFKKLLAENGKLHAPVAAKDCSACHKTHGSDSFRLLVADYPSRFYAPYDLKIYALCYGCHNDKVVSERETTTLTNFRDGSKNLHYVHVNKLELGRTCRACHEVHASKQPHHIREGVPYGQGGWVLKINFTKTPTGETYAKTCHDTKTYVNKALSTVGKSR